MKTDTFASHPGAVSRRRTSIFSVIAALDSLFRERRALDRLDPHLRRDVGLGDAEISHEVRRPVWDVPNWWQ